MMTATVFQFDLYTNVVTFAEQFAFARRIAREFRSFTTAVERDVLSYLADISINYQKKAVKATLNDMVCGKDQRIYSCGLSMSSLQRAIKSLAAKGMLFVHAENKRDVNVYQVNMGWVASMEMRSNVAIPKRKQNGASPYARGAFQRQEGRDDSDTYTTSDDTGENTHFERVNLTNSDGQSDTPLKEELIINKNKNTPYSQPILQEEVSQEGVTSVPYSSQPSMLPRVRLRPVASASIIPTVTPAIAAKVAKTAARAFTNDMCWSAAWEAGFPGVPPQALLGKERGMLATARKRLEGLHMDWFDFFGWCVTNWRHVIRSKFGWMKNNPAPEFPSVMFLCKIQFTNVFMDSYQSRKEHDTIRLLPGEHGIRLKLKMEGMSHDEITFELGRRRSHAENFEKQEAGIEHVRRQIKAVEAQEAALKRETDHMITRFTQASPAPLKSVRQPMVWLSQEETDAIAANLPTEFPAWED